MVRKLELILSNGWRKRRIKLSEYTEKRLVDLSKRYGNNIESLVKILIYDDFEIMNCGEEEDIEKEIESLKQVMFSIETRWASLRYEAHTYMKDNRNLAITLEGFINENKRLHNLLKIPMQTEEIEKIADYYLWL